MPYGRRTRKTRRGVTSRSRRYTKRKVWRNRRRINRKANTQRAKWLNPIRNSQRLKFTYADTGFSVALTPLNNHFAYYMFRGNSCFDPDRTGVGVQPYGYDNYCNDSMFYKYNAFASSIKVYVRLNSPDSARRLHIFVFPWTLDTILTNDVSDIRMIPYHKETVYDSANESTRGAMVKNYQSTRRIYKTQNPRDVGFSPDYNANPTYIWYWIVLFQSDEFTEENFNVYFDVKIKYYTEVSRSNAEPNES